MMRYTFFTIACFAMLARAVAEEKAPPKVTYDDDVKPILQQKCFSCHNPDKKSSDLDLTSYTNLMQGGASGAAVEAGDAPGSYLYQLVTHASEPAMPPESPKMADEMIETLRKWIEGGVLENSGSTAKASKKKKFDLGLSAPSTERPTTVPMPARMSLEPVLYSPHSTAVDAIATSPWAPLAALSGQKQVLLYNTQSLQLLGVLPFPEGVPRVLKFSRNGKLLLAGGGIGGASGRVVVWDVLTGERIIEVGEELDEVLAADISSDQKLVALAGPQRVVRIYATETGQLLHEIRKHTEWVTSMEFSPDSVLLATGDRNGGLFVWEGWTGREYLTLAAHTAGVTDVSWRSDSNVLASCSEDATIRLWEMENGGQVKNWAAHPGGALSVEFTRDSRLFSCGRDKTPKLWDQNGAQQVAFEAFGDLALRASFCDETNRAIAGDWTGEIRVWNAADGARVGQLATNVLPLENRLAEATQLSAAKQNEQQQAEAAYQLAQAAHEKLKADFAAAQLQAVDAKQKADAAAAAIAAAKELASKTTAEHEVAKKQVETATAAMSAAKEAAEKAKVAAAQAADDAALQAAAEAATKASAEQEEQTKVAVAAAAVSLAAMQKAAQDLTAPEKLVTDTAAALAAAQANEQRVMPLVPPAEAAAAAAKSALDQSVAAAQGAQQLVSRWTDEVAFAQKMADLTGRRAEATRTMEQLEAKLSELQIAADTATTALTQGTEALAAAQAESVTSDAAYQEALAAIEAAKMNLLAAAEAKNAATASASSLEHITAKLAEVSVKAEETLALSSQDAGLLAIAQSIKSQLAEKSKRLEVAQADMVTKAEAEQAAAAMVTSTEKTAAELLAMKAQFEAKVTDLTAALAALQLRAQEAAAAVDGAKPGVAEAQQRISALSREITIARGLEPTE